MFDNRLNKIIMGVAVLLICSAVKAEVLTVGQPPSVYETPQAAIAAANDGDTIRVSPGIYIGQVVLDKSLTLEGVGRPILRGSGEGSVLVVLADSCVVKGFIIEHSGGHLQDEDSGILIKSNKNLIEGNDLRDVLFGIYLYEVGESIIRGNSVHGRSELGVGERGGGLHIWYSSENLIEDNEITQARDGIYIQNSNGNILLRNRVTGLRYGLHYMFSDDNRFEDNIFSENVAGAAIMYSHGIEFRRNSFIHNRGFSSFGILLQECDDLLAEGNFIINNGTGLFMEAVRKSTFRRNVIAENDVALQIFASSDQNLIAENNFIENLSPLKLIGRSSNCRWENNGRGNYWSDYHGYDLDGDGIGDRPHKVQNVFEYLEGNYPRLRLYLNSAAAHSLATAEKTFPIIKGSSEKDDAPFMKAIDIAIPLERRSPQPQSQVLLGLISVFAVGLGTLLIWKGRRR